MGRNRIGILLGVLSALTPHTVSTVYAQAFHTDRAKIGNIQVVPKTIPAPKPVAETGPEPTAALAPQAAKANIETGPQAKASSAQNTAGPPTPTASWSGTDLPASRRAARDVAIDVPLKFGNFYLGDVPAKISAAGDVSVNAETLATLFKKIMKPSIVAQLTTTAAGPKGEAITGSRGVTEVQKKSSAAASPVISVSHAVRQDITKNASDRPSSATQSGRDVYLLLSQLKERGLDLTYNPQNAELSVAPTADQKLDGNVSLGGAEDTLLSANVKAPAFFSAYLNTRMVTAYTSHSTAGETGTDGPSFDFDSAIRVGSVVFENEAAVTPQHAAVTNTGSSTYDFTRRGSRFVYDRPDEVIRFKAGDLAPGYMSFQTAPDLLGVSAERVHSHFRPGQSIRPTGQHTFRLERPSNVDILVDGIILRRLRLEPGNYNINDLPLSPGATKISLAIEEDTGGKRTLDFTNFGGQDLLAQGIDEWHVAGGVQSLRGIGRHNGMLPFTGIAYNGPEYLFDAPVATGFYRTGLTQNITGGIHGQASRNVAMGGGSLAAQTPYGYFSIDLSASLGFGHLPDLAWSPNDTGISGPRPEGAGFALRSAYELLNIRGADGRSQSFRISGEYQSVGFATINDYLAPRDYAVSLAMLYSRELTDDLTASLSGTLFLLRDDLFSPQRWDADATLSKRFSPELSGALSLGTGEGGSGFRKSTPCVCENLESFSGVRAFLRLSYRPSAHSAVSFSHDSRTETSRATYTQNHGSGVGSWNTLVDTAHEGPARKGDINGNIDYTGNRGEVSLSHATRLNGIAAGKLNPKSASERTSLRIESGIATADGVWTFGRPVRNSFAIVETHETLGQRELTLGTKETEIGRNDRFAPALVPDISPYSQRRVPIDVDNLPAGYDLGASAFDFYGPYKSGYRVQAGSAYTLTAIGTLIDKNGNPVALLEGVARETSRQDGREVKFFTNRAGRFGIQGLAPGKWTIEMPVEPEPVRYTIDIPVNSASLHRLGQIKPIN